MADDVGKDIGIGGLILRLTSRNKIRLEEEDCLNVFGVVSGSDVGVGQD